MYNFNPPLKVGEFDPVIARDYAEKHLEEVALKESSERSADLEVVHGPGRYALSPTNVAELCAKAFLRVTRPKIQGTFSAYVHTMRQYDRTHSSSIWHQDTDMYGSPAELASGFSSNATQVIVGSVDFSDVLERLQGEQYPPVLAAALKRYPDECEDIINVALADKTAVFCGPEGSELLLSEGTVYDLTGAIHRVNTNVATSNLDTPRAFLFSYNPYPGNF